MKKNIFSFLACLIIAGVFIFYRCSFSDISTVTPLKITTWDALGYYLYLPSIFIYHDVTKLKWFPEIEKKYSVTGGWFYQANKIKNGNYVFKYLGGVAILEAPFFFTGHWLAKMLNYKTDGFSPPYQYSLGFGLMLYSLSIIFLLRYLLLKYFSDLTTAITLILLMLATNIIQYNVIDNAQCHGTIFPLYAVVLFFTFKWHQKPRIIWASLTGFIIGLATICRPTEAIMFLIPLLWNTQTKEAARVKWQLVKTNKKHITFFLLFGLIGISPQLIYWKYVTGSFVFNVGSAWDFLTPHLRVIFGWENGWFIYTPVTVLFIAGLFFMKNYPFRRAVLYFCLVNIYIIISWREWHYAGSYSSRALVESYPVFALAFASLIEQINKSKWRLLFYSFGIYLLCVNLFQIKQYNTSLLNTEGINRSYFFRMYLNNHPSALDMSLLDTKDWLRNESGYQKEILLSNDNTVEINFPEDSAKPVAEIIIYKNLQQNKKHDSWLKIESAIEPDNWVKESYLNSELKNGFTIRHNKIRLFNPLTKSGKINNYAFYIKIPETLSYSRLKIYLNSDNGFKCKVRQIKITYLTKDISYEIRTKLSFGGFI